MVPIEKICYNKPLRMLESDYFIPVVVEDKFAKKNFELLVSVFAIEDQRFKLTRKNAKIYIYVDPHALNGSWRSCILLDIF